MPVRLRFAPSPTGFMHLGNLRTALLNFLFAKKHRGEFWVRLDDTDVERSRGYYTEAIFEDLAWLKLTPDHVFNQSDRLDLYERAFQQLRASGRLYPCYETAEELEIKRKLQLARGDPPTYDREGYRLAYQKRMAYEKVGRRPHWRFRLADEAITWTDLVRGPVHFHGHHLSDPVLVRENGSCVYTLASVVDDLDTGVTHILRGEDHVANTAVQLQLIQALGGDPAGLTFGHIPLVTDEGGHGFSKRVGSLSIDHLREEGLHPMALLSVLAALGTPHAPILAESLKNLIEPFNLGAYGRAAPKLSVDDLWSHHVKLLHHLPYQAVQPHLEGWGLGHISKPFFEAFQSNIEKPSDLDTWWKVCHESRPPLDQPEEADFLKAALDDLPPEPWENETWKTWTQALGKQTHRKGRALYHPLRLALTGLEQGPEMRVLLPWIGLKRAQARLQGEAG